MSTNKDFASMFEPSLSPDELIRIKAEARAVLDRFEDYRQGEVLIQRVKTPWRGPWRPPEEGEPLYRVVFGDRVMKEGNDLQAALSAFVHYMQRPCMGCGRRGCSRDFNPRGTLLVDALREG
jgi:hypothetical protein